MSHGPTRAPALAAVYEAVSELVDSATEADFWRPTGCAAFSVQDLLFHQLLDAQRALRALAEPVQMTPDTDATSYWQKFVAGQEPEDELAHVRFVRRSASAYERPADLVWHWAATASAAASAARRADPDSTVATQGHLMRVDDFLDTLVVEATIHYWDLTLDLRTAPQIPASALAVTVATLEQLVGVALPEDWDDEMVLVKTTGRYPLALHDRELLGDAAQRIPVIR